MSSSNQSSAKPTAALIDKATAGDAEAQYDLGSGYYLGPYARNLEEAVIWLQKAADQGVSGAKSLVAYMYLNGLGTESQPDVAFQYMSEAAEEGFEHARFSLGWYLAHGVAGKKDLRRAIEILSDHSKTYAMSKELLAQLLVCQGDVDDARIAQILSPQYTTLTRVYSVFEYFVRTHDYESIATHGSSHAMAATGKVSKITPDKKDDYEDDYAPQSEAAGDALQLWRAAIRLIYSKGGEEDVKCGIEYLQRSAQAGFPDACCLLGYYHEDGKHGLEQDQSLVLDYFRRAAAHHRPYARYRLAMLETNDVGERWRQIRLAARCGVPHAAYDYAKGLELGLEGKADCKEAVQWYRRAADADHPDATYALALCYKNGIGVEVDEDKSMVYMRRAVRLNHRGAQAELEEPQDIF